MQPPADHGFYRGTNRILGGVCSGVAESLHVDPIWVRLAFVLLAFMQGIGIVVYVILWVVMPEKGRTPTVQTTLDPIAADLRRGWEDIRRQFGGSAPAGPPPPTAPAPPPTPASTAPPPPTAPPAAAPASTSVVPAAAQPGTQNWYWLLGVILIAIGLVYLLINSGLVNWSVIWPVVVIGIGILLLVRNLGRRP